MAREGSETAAQREGSLWRDKPVLLFMLFMLFMQLARSTLEYP